MHSNYFIQINNIKFVSPLNQQKYNNYVLPYLIDYNVIIFDYDFIFFDYNVIIFDYDFTLFDYKYRLVIIKLFSNKVSKMKVLLIITSLIVYIYSQFTLKQTTYSLSTNQTFATGVNYQINFTLTNKLITTGSSISLTFATQYRIPSATLSGCMVSTATTGIPTIATCSAIYNSGLDKYSIIFTGIYPTSAIQTFLWLKFKINNPWAETSSRVDIYIIDTGAITLDTVTFFLPYSAVNMTGCSITTSSQLTGDNSTKTIIFTPSANLISGSYILVTLPMWFIGTSTQISNIGSSSLTCSGVQNTDISNIPCSIQNATSSTQTINLTNFITSNKTSPGQISINIQNIRNPWSFNSFGEIKYQIYYTTALISQRCSNIFYSVTQTNAFKLVTFNITTNTISTLNSDIQLILAINNPAPKNKTILKVNYPSAVGVTYTGATTQVLPQNGSQMVFTNIAATSDKTIGSIVVMSFFVTTPPSTRPYTFSFTTQYALTASTFYSIDSISQTFTNNPGAITSTIPIFLADTAINAVTSYQIQFKVTNAMISGSFIQIIFPSTLTIDPTATCTPNITSYSTCTTSTSNVTIVINGALPAGTSFLVTVSKVKNSHDSIISSTFKIYTYYDSLYDSLIDKLQSGLTVTMTSNLITTATVTPLNTSVYTTTSYLFSFTLKDDIPKNGYIELQFPSTVSPIQASLTIVSSSFSASTCTLNPVGSIVQVLNCFLATSLAAAPISISIGGIRNPVSTLTSASCKIRTYSGMPSLLNSISTSLTVKMTAGYVLAPFTFAPAISTVHSLSTVTVSVTHVVPLAVNDYILITLDSTMALSATLVCTPVTGLTGISCIPITNLIQITYTSLPSALALTYTIASVRNYDIADVSLTFNMQVFASDGSLKQTSSSSVAYTQAFITTFLVNNDDKIILYDYSQLTLTITSPFSIASSFLVSKTMLTINLPIGLTSATNSTCSVSIGTCTRISSTVYQIVNVGLTMTTYSIVMTNVLLPFINVQSASFSVVYTYNNNNVSVVEAGVVVKPFCTSPCKACDTTPNKCVNCLPSPNNLKYFNRITFNCEIICPDGTYPDALNICQNCVPPCNKCLDSLNCVSCMASNWLYNQRCDPTCPDQFFNDSSGVCLACVPPCNKCLTSAICLSCSINFYSNYACVNATNCPSGTYANTTLLTCLTCKTPCANCYQTQSNCTSCVINFFYYTNICAPQCPTSMYKSGSNCLSCVNPCNTCLNNTYCNTCATDYLYNGNCLLSTNCPIGTYPNSTLMQCRTCPAGCTSCTSNLICTTCNTAFYVLYQSTCITTCPDGTYKSGFTCQTCQPPCSTCVNASTICLSCVSPNYMDNNACGPNCPTGKYENINVCSPCLSTCYDCNNGISCTQCAGQLYHTLAGQCLSTCPYGTYQNALNNVCTSCTIPCSDCSLTPTNCTSCIAPQVLYVNSCNSSTCPAQYFAVNGVCLTCSHCVNCLDSQTCSQCSVGYFIFAGVCYNSCPITAPIQDLITQSCTICSSICRTCINEASNCTSCTTGQYLFNSGCYTQCPSGYIQNLISQTCIPKQLSSIFYFPSVFLFFSLSLILIYSKFVYKQTQFVTLLTAFTSLFTFISWIAFGMVIYQFQTSLDSQLITIFAVVSAAEIIISIILGISYQIYLKCTFQDDKGYNSWLQHSTLHTKVHWFIISLSFISFIFYRFMYGRMFNRVYFSLYYSNGDGLFSSTYTLTLITILIQLLPMVGVSFYTIYSKQIYDQTVYSSLDSLIINSILIILLFIDGAKNGEQFFNQMKASLPFIRQKYLEVQSMKSFIDFDYSQVQIEQKVIKSEIGIKDRQKYFRKITCIENLNKYGHLNQIQIKQKQVTKSLPQLKQLYKLTSYDPYNIQQDDHNVMDDLFFNQQNDQLLQLRRKQQQQKLLKEIQEQQARKRNQQNMLQLEKKRIQEEKIKFQEKRRIQAEQRRIIEEQQRLQRQRLQKLLEDQREQADLQCIDIAAIDKAQNKNKAKKSPLQFLSKCKTVDQKPIDQKALKKLQQMAKKNGIDAQFMKQTFGVQKNHNQQLLNSIIDKHNHVNRQAVKQMFKQTNNKQVLQQLFSKNSTVDTQRLKDLMNDKNGLKMIQSLLDEEKGIVSAEIAKILLDKNSKYKPQFVKNLLSNTSGADQNKLQQLLRNETDPKQKQANLKALKKIGGQKFQNTKLIQNMLGEQSLLDEKQFTKVVNNLSLKTLQSIFSNKNPQNQQVISKVLNNKKLNLKQLSSILQNEQIVYQLGKVLANGDPVVQQNLMNLLKNLGEQADPQKVREFLQNPVFIQKLMGNSTLDPQFLMKILSKQSHTNFDLLQQTLKNMTDQDVKKIFQFTGQKNIDYKSLSKLFDYNLNTDPQLVLKMMDPSLVEQIYTKNSNLDPKILSKLVQKGSKFDKQNIINIYGTKTDNHISPFNQLNGNDPQNNGLSDNQKTQYDFKFTFNKTANQNFKQNGQKGNNPIIDNQLAMSRTDGGMMGFLNPLKLKQHKQNQLNQQQNQLDQQNEQYNQQNQGYDQQGNQYKFPNKGYQQENRQYNLNNKNRQVNKANGQKKQSKSKLNGFGQEFQDLDQDLQNSLDNQNYDTFQRQDDAILQQDQDGTGIKRRKHVKKKKPLKKVTDIRHPSEKIYLEPIRAAHQVQASKNIRKKKRDHNQSANKLIMDEDNDVFDIDF